jgi:hypothetical protein
MNGRRDTFVVDTQSYAGKPHRVGLDIGLDSVDLGGPVVSHVVEPVDQEGLVISVSLASSVAETPRTVYQRELGWNADGSTFRMLLPGYLATDQLGPEDPLAELVMTGDAQDAPPRAP